MKHYCCFFLLLLNILVENRATPIIGGQIAVENDYKYLVSIKTFGKRFDYGHICTGSVLSQYWVITAAHCFMTWIHLPFPFTRLNIKKIKKDMVLHIGSHRLEPKEKNAYYIEDVKRHPKFDYRLVNDIALIKVKNKINLGDNIGIIQLPNRELVSPGITVTMAGWGFTTNDEAQPIWLQILHSSNVVSTRRCGFSGPYALAGVAEKSVICTLDPKGTGPCNSDSGGPLVVKDNDDTEYLVGVISHAAFSKECAVGEPEVHMNLFYYKDWIHKTIL